jgi:formate dehydrogenase subunit gamma
LRPAAPACPPAVQALIEQHRHTPGGLLPLLHAVQDSQGHVAPDWVPAIAQAFQRSRAEVHGVITYYHHFRQQPAGRHVVQICQAEACRACGSSDLTQAAERILGTPLHSTRADGAVTLEPVYCLGLCAQSPAARVDDRPVARLTPQRLQSLAAGWGLAPVASAAASLPVEP